MSLVFVLFALFASVFTISKTALEYAQPFFLVGIRMFAAGGLMLAYQYWRDPAKLRIKREDYSLVFKLALFNIYLTNTFEFWGLQYLTSFKTCFIYSLSPFVSALFSYVILSEKMSPKKWMGLIVGCIGFAPILLSQSSSENETGHLLFLSWAELAVLIACISSVYGWILLKQLVRDRDYNFTTANGWSMAVGGALALIHSLFTEEWNPIPATEFMPFFECAVALMIISNLICYNLYGYLLKKYSATFISFAGFTTPLFTATFGWLFLKETVTIEFYISSAIVLVGLYIFNMEELKLEEAVPTNETVN